MAQAKPRGGKAPARSPRAGGPPPPPPPVEDEPPDRGGHGAHEHLMRADPGWWAVFAYDDGFALPVPFWLMELPDEDADTPEFVGLVPGGLGTWDRADELWGFADYTYQAGAAPTPAEVREIVSRVVRQHREPDLKDPGDPWTELEELRAWLRGQPSAPR